MIPRRERSSAADVAIEIGIGEDRAKVYLHELDVTHKMINWFGNMDTQETTYAINFKGRRLLLDRGVSDDKSGFNLMLNQSSQEVIVLPIERRADFPWLLDRVTKAIHGVKK